MRGQVADGFAPSRRTIKRDQDIAVPLRLKIDAGPLSFIITTTVFGTAVDVTVSEVTIEAFFPADQETAIVMAGLGQLRQRRQGGTNNGRDDFTRESKPRQTHVRVRGLAG